MKFKTTQKAIRNNATFILSANYCSLQHLLNFENPVAYNCGVYGWNCDYYSTREIDGSDGYICTGYRPHGKHIPYETAKKYETIAEKIVYDYKRPYEERKQELKNLIRQLIDEMN